MRAGHVDEVRQGRSLTDVFIETVGGGDLQEGSFGWLGAKRGAEDPRIAGEQEGEEHRG